MNRSMPTIERNRISQLDKERKCKFQERGSAQRSSQCMQQHKYLQRPAPSHLSKTTEPSDIAMQTCVKSSLRVSHVQEIVTRYIGN